MCENYLELFAKSTFTENEVPLLSEAASSLILNRGFDEFEKLLYSLQDSKVIVLKRNEKFLRAMIAFYYERNCYEQVIDLLKSGEFSDYTGLIDIWDDAHYAQKERQIGKPLTPLIKFRTRQKFPPPKNISPSGERVTKKLSEEAKSVLKNWMSKNTQNPYPTQETREELASRTGLTLYQVKTWFANARRRQKISDEANRKRYQLHENSRKILLNRNAIQQNKIQYANIERDDIEIIFRSEKNISRTVYDEASKSVSSFSIAQLSDQNNNVSVKVIPPQRDDNHCEGIEGIANCCDGLERKASCCEGIERERYLCKGIECNQNQVNSSCIQHLAQLCRNITQKNLPNSANNIKEVGKETEYETSDVRYNYQQPYCLQGNNDHPLSFQNYETGEIDGMGSINRSGLFSLASCPENIYIRGQDQFLNQNLVHQVPNIAFAGQTNFQSSSPPVQYNQLLNHIPIPNQGLFNSSYMLGTSPQQYCHLPFQTFLQACQTPTTPKFISSGTQTNDLCVQRNSYDTLGLFDGQVQSTRYVNWTDNVSVIPARPNSCPLPASQPLIRLLCGEHRGLNLSTNQQQSDNANWYGEDIQLTPPQCTEEQDVAKVLLDLSSQHSSQESS